jgi:hypothetical protein
MTSLRSWLVRADVSEVPVSRLRRSTRNTGAAVVFTLPIR